MASPADALPSFTDDGLLPPADHVLSLEALAESLLVAGPAATQEDCQWDRQWRKQLITNLGVLVRQLWHMRPVWPRA